MVNVASAQTQPIRAKRERSPSFPFIPLQTAVSRLVAFEDYFKRHPALAKQSGLAWGMKGWTSQAQQTLAALKSFGFMSYQGSGESLQATISEAGRTYLRAQQESTKQEVLRRAALTPKAISTYFKNWGADRPRDPICLDRLILKDGFNEYAAKNFLSVYDATIAFAGLADSDKISNLDDGADDDSGDDADLPPPPTPTVKVGDYVRWAGQPFDQGDTPRKVVGIFPDGEHVQVFGSNTGIPMSDLTVVDAPAATSLVTPPVIEAASAGVQGENEFSVLQRGERLQITADVDLEGLATLKEMLGDYESILRRLAGKKPNG